MFTDREEVLYYEVFVWNTVILINSALQSNLVQSASKLNCFFQMVNKIGDFLPDECLRIVLNPPIKEAILSLSCAIGLDSWRTVCSNRG